MLRSLSLRPFAGMTRSHIEVARTSRPLVDVTPLLKRHVDAHSRFMSRVSHRAPVRRQATEDLLKLRKKIEAIYGELPSTPVGSPTGHGPESAVGGGGGSRGSGIKDAVLSTVVGVVVRKYLLSSFRIFLPCKRLRLGHTNLVTCFVC